MEHWIHITQLDLWWVMVFISFLLLLSANVWSAEALVRVLEAPLFSEPYPEAEVVQYLRKGEKIKIHNIHVRKPVQDEEFLEVSEKGVIDYNKKYPDKSVTQNLDDTPEDFIKTRDRLGREAFILKEHIAILYFDPRELDEKPLKYDPTDYRIEEPLPKDYPFKQEYKIPHEGIISLGYINSNARSYSYTENVTDASLQHGLTLNAVWSRQKEKDETLFWGYQFQLKVAKTKYELETRIAEEGLVRAGFGVYGHYIFYEKKDWRLNINGGARLNIWDSVKIRQTVIDSETTEARYFKGPSVSVHSGLFYQYKAFAQNTSFIIGYELTPTLPLSQTSSNKVTNSSWWQGEQGENLGARILLDQSIFIGFLVRQ